MKNIKNLKDTFCSLIYKTARYRFLKYTSSDMNLGIDRNRQINLEIEILTIAIEKHVNELKKSDKSSEKINYFVNATEAILNGNESIFPLPFNRSYWVIPGFLMAGEIPSAQSDRERIEKIRGIVDSGIRSVVNLIESEECNFSGKKLIDYSDEMLKIAKESEVNLAINRFAIKDLDIPTVDFMVDILNHIKKDVLEEKPVYVHCWGGIGRTGTTVGSFLINEGICDVKEVIDFIKFLKRDTNIAHRDSPETSDQVEFIQNWKPNLTKNKK
jgi:hypothetical protein